MCVINIRARGHYLITYLLMTNKVFFITLSVANLAVAEMDLYAQEGSRAVWATCLIGLFLVNGTIKPATVCVCARWSLFNIAHVFEKMYKSFYTSWLIHPNNTLNRFYIIRWWTDYALLRSMHFTFNICDCMHGRNMLRNFSTTSIKDLSLYIR